MDKSLAAAESFGEYLTRERTLRNIALEEMSQRTRISMKVLQALEQGDWEELPADVYVRGFLRTYARYLGLDENEVLMRYEDHRPGPAIRGREVFQEPSKRRARRRTAWLFLIILVCLCLALYWFWLRPAPSPNKASQRPAPAGPNLRFLPMPPPPQTGN